MHRLGTTIALAAAVAAFSASTTSAEVVAAPAEDDSAVEMALPGMTVPSGRAEAEAGTAEDATVLAPSCSMTTPGACDRLEAICAELHGVTTDNSDGSLSCVIVLDLTEVAAH